MKSALLLLQATTTAIYPILLHKIILTVDTITSAVKAPLNNLKA
jgi:hypothetical protein